MLKTLMYDPKLFEKDLSGRIYIVTGANSGSGFATAMSCSDRSAECSVRCHGLKVHRQLFTVFSVITHRSTAASTTARSAFFIPIKKTDQGLAHVVTQSESA